MLKGKLIRISILVILVSSVFIFSLRLHTTDTIEPNKIKISENLRNESQRQTESSKVYTYRIYTTIPQEILQKILGVSFLPEGPVKLEDLSYIELTYWGFDQRTHRGEIIVHKLIAKEVVEIFKEIYAAKFPIAKMKLIDEYQANDDLSMADNNTSGLCIRKVRGTDRYSKHSLGLAIDINPVQNPYLSQGIVLPQAGQDYVERKNLREGMIVKGDVVYEAFIKRGWTWGGEWNTLKDYQHFEKNINFNQIKQ